jgi:hypothetical protein
MRFMPGDFQAFFAILDRPANEIIMKSYPRVGVPVGFVPGTF